MGHKEFVECLRIEAMNLQHRSQFELSAAMKDAARIIEELIVQRDQLERKLSKAERERYGAIQDNMLKTSKILRLEKEIERLQKKEPTAGAPEWKQAMLENFMRGSEQ